VIGLGAVGLGAALLIGWRLLFTRRRFTA